MSYEQVLFARRSLERALTDIIETAKELEYLSLVTKKPSILAAEREKILARLYSYLLNGYSFQFAKNRLCEEFNKTAAAIDNLCNAYYAHHVSQLRPMKIYATKILKAAGHTNRQIAALLDITPQTVTKYLLLANRR